MRQPTHLDVSAESIIECPKRSQPWKITMRSKWSDIEMAFEFTNVGGGYEHQAYLCRQTGKLYWHSETYDDNEEELPGDIDDEEKYLKIPDKRELGLGKPLALDFARKFLPDDFDHVRAMFSRSGAYPRFKDLLNHRRAVDQWHDFENEMTGKALREWCKENSIEIIEVDDEPQDT